MLTNKQKLILRNVWSTFNYHFDNIDWTHYAEELLAMTKAESRRFNQARPDHLGCGLTIDQEAKFFALKRFAEYAIAGEEGPSADEYMMIQRSCFAAYSLAKNKRFSEPCAKVLATCTEELKEILSWNYSDLNKA